MKSFKPTVPEKILPFVADCEFLFDVWKDELERLHPELIGDVVNLVEGNTDTIPLANRDSHSLYLLSHAISTLFQLYNLAEEHHRTRRLHYYETQPDRKPEPGTFASWLAKPNQNETRIEEWSKLSVRIVFTAHPTELRRPAVIRQLNRLTTLLSEYEIASSEAVRKELVKEFREPVRTLLTTGDIRNQSVTPFHEVRDLWAQLGVLWDAVGLLHTKLDGTFTNNARVNSPLKFGCWVGVDADGNPNITPETMRYSAETLRRMALSHYLTECETIAGTLTTTNGLVEFPHEIFDFITQLESAIPNRASQLGNRYRSEPFRRAMALIIERVRDSLRSLPEDKSLAGYETVRVVEASPVENPYKSSSEFGTDLTKLADFVKQTLGESDSSLESLLFRVHTFGFHFAGLEHRFHANELRNALLAFYPHNNTDPESLWQWVTEIFQSGKSLPAIQYPATPVFERLAAAAELRRKFGAECLDTIILSGSSRYEEMYGLSLLSEAMGIENKFTAPVQIVPLFETIPDLTNAPQVLEKLLSTPRWSERLRRLDNIQEIMLGYSDSGKDGGIVASTLALDTGARELFNVGKKHGIALQFFHGRGGTVARGGGPLYRSIVATPESVGNGHWKLTEQGEMIATRYSHPKLAERVFEQLLVATIDAIGLQKSSGSQPAINHSYAKTSERVWRELVYETPGFADFFLIISPLRELSALRIGSRPAKRMESNRIEDLRAIPWAFAWLQNRLNLPGWYGFGSAIASLRNDSVAWKSTCTEFTEQPILRLLLTKLAITTALTDVTAADHFFQLADESCSAMRKKIESEFAKTCTALRELSDADSQRSYLLFQISLDLRKAPLHLLARIQTELLKRYRIQEGATVETMLQKAILQSVIAVAAGIRNSG